MFASWRFRLREVEEQLKHGQLDEACQQLQREGLADYLPGKRLALRLSTELAQRACRQAQDGAEGAAWRDAETARQLAGETPQLLELRQELLRLGLRQVERHLGASDAVAAMRAIEALEKHVPSHSELQTLRQVAQRLQSAINLARRGKFGEAEDQLQGAIAIRPDGQILQQTLQEIQAKHAQSRPLHETLHRALSEQAWSRVLSLADQLLELAPDCRLALDARKRAWRHVGARVSQHTFEQNQAWTGPPPRAPDHVSADSAPPAVGERQFVLWVDGVGGYLVCMGDEVTLGQATLQQPADIPIRGDLFRQHASICRSGEGYSLNPLHRVAVNNKAIHSRVLLSDGDEIELGSGVRLRFRRPHALSATARIDFLSRHRTQPSVDGVLLMAESCVLGPKWQNHVVCRDWSDDVVLYRHKNAFYCRAMTPIEVDGQWYDGRGPVVGNSHIAGSDFSMSLEELDRCSTQPLL